MLQAIGILEKEKARLGINSPRKENGLGIKTKYTPLENRLVLNMVSPTLLYSF